MIDVLGVVHVVLYVVLWTILPMIFYENPFAMNALYSAMLLHSGFVGLINGMTLFVTTIKLEKLYMSSERFQDANYNSVMKRVYFSSPLNELGINLPPTSSSFHLPQLKLSKRVWINSLPLNIPLLLFPVWIGVTLTATDPGLQGIFYFHLIILGFTKVGAITASYVVVYRVTKSAQESSSTSSSSPPSSHNQQQQQQHQQQQQQKPDLRDSSTKSFTFTVEEINS